MSDVCVNISVLLACLSVKDRSMKLKSDCIFCRIIGRQSPAYIVLESDHFICFFPLKPDVHGHTLIVSKEHYHDIRDCPAELGTDLLLIVQSLSKR